MKPFGCIKLAKQILWSSINTAVLIYEQSINYVADLSEGMVSFCTAIRFRHGLNLVRSNSCKMMFALFIQITVEHP